jgi:hypothetical protein
MMRRSQNPLGSGGQEYFNEKRPVNLRIDGTAHPAEFFPRMRECWPTMWFFPSGGNPETNRRFPS